MSTLCRWALIGSVCLTACEPAQQEPAGGEQTAAATEEVQPAHAETRDLMTLVASAAELVGAQGAEACAAFKEEGSRWLHGDTYVFIVDAGGMEVCHPAMPELEGTNILDMTDAGGKPLIRHMLAALEDGRRGSWTHYQWPRPGEQTPTWKTTYALSVQGPDGAGYVVGSGLYDMPMERLFVVDLVDRAVERIRREGTAAFARFRDATGPYLFADTYVFVTDERGTEIVNPASPELEGENMWDFQDAGGKYVSREIVQMLETREAGWIDYLWPRPGETEPARKSSYVRKVVADGQTLYVGCGVYLDEVAEGS